MPNALAKESSPYLRQHASNPVDWLPWGPTALQRTRDEDKPLLVSIGYSSCHWCHVMERESFEDERVAALMNESFVCVKVDREERPDVDAIYMEAVQAMTGGGGWPLNVFLTPEQLPFFGGTYYPPQPRPGMPSWTQVLEAIAAAWREQSQEIRGRVEQLRQRLSGAAMLNVSPAPLDPDALREAVNRLASSFDAQHGGFGDAPKFPQPTVIELLLTEAASGNEQAGEMALASLRAIAAGGIHDLVGGGFHRYAVDDDWSVPHFEKMLYDNALLASAYLHAFKLDGDERLLEVCLDTLRFMQRELQGPEGGFYCALDADSDGVEGAFYVWTISQLQQVLGPKAQAAIAWTGASEEGNFVDPHHPVRGRNVLSDRPSRPRPKQETVQAIRARLLSAREERNRPGLDDKRLTSWNALTISAFAEAGAFVGGEQGASLLAQARRCADFLLEQLRAADGRLLRVYGDGGARIDAFLEDHAFLLEALIALYQASFEERWLIEARRLAETMIARFADPDGGGFFSTALDGEPLVVRRKDIDDTPIPSGTSSAALGLLRLAALTGEHAYEQPAISALQLLRELAPQHPLAFGHALQALRLHLAPIAEVAIVGPDGPARDALIGVVRESHRPACVLAVGPGDESPTTVPLLEGRVPVGGRPTAYVCERFSCQQPVSEPEELRALLDGHEGPTAPRDTDRAPTSSPARGSRPIPGA